MYSTVPVACATRLLTMNPKIPNGGMRTKLKGTPTSKVNKPIMSISFVLPWLCRRVLTLRLPNPQRRLPTLNRTRKGGANSYCPPNRTPTMGWESAITPTAAGRTRKEAYFTEAPKASSSSFRASAPHSFEKAGKRTLLIGNVINPTNTVNVKATP